MMAEIQQEHDFFTWSIQNFVRKMKKKNKLYDTDKLLISCYAICY